MIEKDILIAAKALLPTPETWTKGAYARNKDGESISNVASTEVTCRCMAGALRSACTQFLTGDYGVARRLLETRLPGPEKDRFIPLFNDHPETTFEMVHAQFDRAIEEAELCQ